MAIIIKPLTALDIKNAQIEEGKLTLRDGEGLILDVTPSSKKWRFVYRAPITKKRTSITFGDYPTLSLKEAREKRAEFKALLLENVDPIEYRESIKRKIVGNLENSLYKVALKWRDFKLPKIMQATMDDDWARLENHIFPYIKDHLVTQINSQLLVKVMTPVYRKGHTSVIEKVLRTLNEIMDYAENTGLIEMHNCHKTIKAFHIKPAENNPTIEAEELPEFISKMLMANIKPQTRHLVFWNLLTAVRPAEAVSVEWSEIDWEKKLWTIPKHKMKGHKLKKREHIVPLSTQALEILTRMKAFSGTRRFVFPHALKSGEPMSSGTVNVAMRRQGYAGTFTSHGMRALVSTYINAKDVNMEVVDAVLSHKVKGKTRKVYNRHNYLEQRIPVMQFWGDYVEQCGLK